jgi:flagellar export protein FliJ
MGTTRQLQQRTRYNTSTAHKLVDAIALQVLSQHIAAQQDVVAQAAQGVEEQRQQLLVARQETKVIEKLRDKAQRRALLEHTRREQQWLDELALMRSRHEL